MIKPKRQKHNYTSELELKCLLIRIKNRNLNNGDFSEMNNRKVNKYIKLFNKINSIKYPQDQIQRKNIIKYRIKDKAIELAEKTKINVSSYENFGSIILLMISKILTKPNFSGYTYKDEMYSDAIHKILKYLHNFDHKMISERSGEPVNSFAYISQIIHNSVIYIINTKKKEQDNIKNQVSMEIVNHQLGIKDHNKHNSLAHISDADYEDARTRHEIYLDYIPNGLCEEIKNVGDYGMDKTIVYIPQDYIFTMKEYNEINVFLKKNMSIVRMKKEEILDDDGDLID